MCSNKPVNLPGLNNAGQLLPPEWCSSNNAGFLPESVVQLERCWTCSSYILPGAAWTALTSSLGAWYSWNNAGHAVLTSSLRAWCSWSNAGHAVLTSCLVQPGQLLHPPWEGGAAWTALTFSVTAIVHCSDSQTTYWSSYNVTPHSRR